LGFSTVHRRIRQCNQFVGRVAVVTDGHDSEARTDRTVGRWVSLDFPRQLHVLDNLLGDLGDVVPMWEVVQKNRELVATAAGDHILWPDGLDQTVGGGD